VWWPVWNEQSELKRLGRFKHDLEATFRDNIRILLLLALFSDEQVARQLVPTGSDKVPELVQLGFVGENGNVMVPAPPVGDIDSGPWVAFQRTVTSSPSLFSQIRFEATVRGGFPE